MKIPKKPNFAWKVNENQQKILIVIRNQRSYLLRTIYRSENQEEMSEKKSALDWEKRLEVVFEREEERGILLHEKKSLEQGNRRQKEAKAGTVISLFICKRWIVTMPCKRFIVRGFIYCFLKINLWWDALLPKRHSFWKGEWKHGTQPILTRDWVRV